VLILENAWYSLISPENFSTILWRSLEYIEQAAEALILTAKDMLKNKLIDGIIEEPLGGAHLDWETTAETIKQRIKTETATLTKKSAQKRISERIDKFCSMGVVN
ncbi:MAG: acetyl-CoA carboxylase carboxyl transferase subunit alpha, partial [Spirosomaceae bacterium]|nr:acetyl-CoA carboxylase carboxyl transferase subunit alpha [Spirosomataceae bacterium]